MMRGGKIIKWTLIGGASTGLVLLVFCVLVLDQQYGRYDEFTQAHADAPGQAARHLARLAETTPTLALRPGPQAGAAATTSTRFFQKLSEFQAPFFDVQSVDRASTEWISANMGAREMVLALDAGDFPEEGITGPLRAGPALRKKIAEEARRVVSDAGTWQSREAKMTTAGLAAPMRPLLNKASEVLGAEWSAEDFKTSDTLYGYFHGFWATASLAAMREALGGDAAQAGALLERTAQLGMLTSMARFPLRLPYGSLQRTLLTVGGRGMPLDSELAGVQKLLEAGRLDERELADLRGAYVMNVNTLMGPEEVFDRIIEQGHPAWMAAGEVALDRATRAYIMAQVRPVAIAWASGDEAAFWRMAVSPLGKPFAPVVYSRYFPADLAPFAPDPLATANEDIDMTRLVAAAARYRIRQGRWPEGIGELAGYGLSPFPVQGKASAWGIAKLEAAAPGPDGAATPVFFFARRMMVNPAQFRVNFGYNRTGNETFYDYSRIERGGRGLVKPLILVRAIWPRMEDYPEGFLEALAGK